MHSAIRCLVLVLIMIVQLSFAVPAANAETGGYPYADSTMCAVSCQNDPWGFYKRECVSFVAWKLNTTNGLTFKNNYDNSGGLDFQNASNWKSAAERFKFTVDNNPAAGAVAWWSFGHVAWVESVNGEYITLQEYNYDYKGNYSRRVVRKNTIDYFIHFKDLQTSVSPPNPVNGPGRLMFINAQGAAYAKDGLLDAYTRLNDPGNTVSISAGGQYMAIVNACGAVWAKSTLGDQGWIQQTDCGIARAVRITSTARVMILNACSAAWAKDGLQRDGWNQLTHCWEAKAIAAAGKFMMIINQCGAAWAKDTLGMAGWAQQNDCGGTHAIAVGSSGRVMIINQCGEAWAKDGLVGYGWAQQTSCGDTRAIAVGGRRLVFINAQGIVYAKDDLLGPYHPMTLEEGATTIATGSAGRIMIINQCGEAWAKDTLGMHGWAQQTSCGDAQMIAVG